MNEISIGAVGAAVIAGLVSLLGLIIGKEQKVSEFRQEWINDLRKCMVSYVVQINAISDLVRLGGSGNAEHKSRLLDAYKLLNEASHGITLRINADEEPAKALLGAMSKFEDAAACNDNLKPEAIKIIELDFLSSAKSLLKFEWCRVKKGEKAFVATKRIVSIAIVIMVSILIYSLSANDNPIKIPQERELHLQPPQPAPAEKSPQDAAPHPDIGFTASILRSRPE